LPLESLLLHWLPCLLLGEFQLPNPLQLQLMLQLLDQRFCLLVNPLAFHLVDHLVNLLTHLASQVLLLHLLHLSWLKVGVKLLGTNVVTVKVVCVRTLVLDMVPVS